MSAIPFIAIYVRHTPGCKYVGDEYARRCNCRKHFRWTQEKKQFRRKAGTRSWEDAERLKRELEDELAGKKPVSASGPKTLPDAIKLFIQHKTIEGVSNDRLKRYERELSAFREHCHSKGVLMVGMITKQIITTYAAGWKESYPSTNTRVVVRDRLKTFLQFAFDAEWLARVPGLPVIRVDETPTLPLTPEELKALLDAIPVAFPGVPAEGMKSGLVKMHAGSIRLKPRRIRALILLQRYSGLSIMDAVTVPTASVLHDAAKIPTARRAGASRAVSVFEWSQQC